MKGRKLYALVVMIMVVTGIIAAEAGETVGNRGGGSKYAPASPSVTVDLGDLPPGLSHDFFMKKFEVQIERLRSIKQDFKKVPDPKLPKLPTQRQLAALPPEKAEAQIAEAGKTCESLCQEQTLGGKDSKCEQAECSRACKDEKSAASAAHEAYREAQKLQDTVDRLVLCNRIFNTFKKNRAFEMLEREMGEIFKKDGGAYFQLNKIPHGESIRRMSTSGASRSSALKPVSSKAPADLERCDTDGPPKEIKLDKLKAEVKKLGSLCQQACEAKAKAKAPAGKGVTDCPPNCAEQCAGLEAAGTRAIDAFMAGAADSM